MQEKLLQFKLQKVWILVDLPKGHRAIGTKWVYRNKKDEMGIVIEKIKARHSSSPILSLQSACARFQLSSKRTSILSFKRIFRYLKGKPSLGLWYSKDSPLELVAYTVSDYAGSYTR
ncbi:putative ribonuclease H-like domain-containing protein [Tanacetum coccineum]|uniref:Ribonuclease H-like domain-containing protein n=1 Tax=Tanacetum coccineum TaxID=301880 RepID=A0ABQ5EAB8_9ASTR